MPVSSLVTRTVTPGRTAPPESTTLPPSAEVPCWASTDAAHSKRLPATTMTRARILRLLHGTVRMKPTKPTRGPLIQLGNDSPRTNDVKKFQGLGKEFLYQTDNAVVRRVL